MPQFPRLLLAVSPGNTLPQLPASVELAHMAYRIGPRCRLLRTRPELDLNGGFLMISGAASSCLGDWNSGYRSTTLNLPLGPKYSSPHRSPAEALPPVYRRL